MDFDLLDVESDQIENRENSNFVQSLLILVQERFSVQRRMKACCHGTIAKLPVGSGTSSKYISVVRIEECPSQRDR